MSLHVRLPSALHGCGADLIALDLLLYHASESSQ